MALFHGIAPVGTASVWIAPVFGWYRVDQDSITTSGTTRPCMPLVWFVTYCWNENFRLRYLVFQSSYGNETCMALCRIISSSWNCSWIVYSSSLSFVVTTVRSPSSMRILPSVLFRELIRFCEQTVQLDFELAIAILNEANELSTSSLEWLTSILTRKFWNYDLL